MPAPAENLLVQESTSTVRVALEPAHNIFYSLVLLSKTEEHHGFSEWVTLTRQQMTADEILTNEIVMIGFYFSIVPLRSWTSFPAYLTHLENLPAEAMRQRMLDKYAQMCADDQCQPEDKPAREVDFDQILASSENYVNFLLEHFGPDVVDPEMEARAFTYVIDPPAMKELIVSHLKSMWNKYMRREWDNVRPMLLDAVNAFQQVDLSGMDKLEAASFITGQELADVHWVKMLQTAEQMVFVPSAHIGPYLWIMGRDGRVYILFGARLPSGVQFDAPDLSRTEIIVRLNALADDSRLRILRYIAENGEQRAQDVIQVVDLSQSAVSRHLSHLSAAGFLSVRRCEGGKCYRLNLDRISDTLKAVEAYLRL